MRYQAQSDLEDKPDYGIFGGYGKDEWEKTD